MLPNWYQTPTLAAEHRATLERAAMRHHHDHRVRRGYRLRRRAARTG